MKLKKPSKDQILKFIEKNNKSCKALKYFTILNIGICAIICFFYLFNQDSSYLFFFMVYGFFSVMAALLLFDEGKSVQNAQIILEIRELKK